MTTAPLIMQRTLRRPIRFIGIGLHSGRRVSMVVHPGLANGGITFIQKSRLRTRAIIPASWEHVVNTELCTQLGSNGATISTVEHVMAALHGCCIDNAFVVVNGPEIPILDGSAASLAKTIMRTGTVTQPAPRRAIRVLAPLHVRQNERWARLEPDDSTRLTVEIDFQAAAIGRQHYTFDIAGGGFVEQIAPARTFGFLRDIQSLRNNGFAAGGSLANAVIVHDDQVLNEEGLRFADEFVRHKVLDCVGDLALATAPVLGHLTTYRPGHVLNHALIRKLMTRPASWEWVNLRADKSGAAVPIKNDAPADQRLLTGNERRSARPWIARFMSR